MSLYFYIVILFQKLRTIFTNFNFYGQFIPYNFSQSQPTKTSLSHFGCAQSVLPLERQPWCIHTIMKIPTIFIGLTPWSMKNNCQTRLL